MRREIFAAFISTIFLVSCGGPGRPNESVGAATGAAVGAGAGAVVGHQTGRAGEGALVGAATGAVAGGLTGAVIDNERERKTEEDPTIARQKKEMEQQERERDDAALQDHYNRNLEDYLDSHQ